MPQQAASQTGLLPGFDNIPFQSNAVFRQILDAMARPGKIVDLPTDLPAPVGLTPAATAFALGLIDVDTTVWLSPACDTDAVRTHLKFHCGCPITDDAAQADFAIAQAGEDLSDILSALKIGTAEYPDRSATLVLIVESLRNHGENAMTLSGPGIETTHSLAVSPLPTGFASWHQTNRTLFPCGVDVVFAADQQFAALPRTTRIKD